MSSRTAEPKVPGVSPHFLLPSETIYECSNPSVRICRMRFTPSRPSRHWSLSTLGSVPSTTSQHQIFPERVILADLHLEINLICAPAECTGPTPPLGDKTGMREFARRK